MESDSPVMSVTMPQFGDGTASAYTIAPAQAARAQILLRSDEDIAESVSRRPSQLTPSCPTTRLSGGHSAKTGPAPTKVLPLTSTCCVVHDPLNVSGAYSMPRRVELMARSWRGASP